MNNMKKYCYACKQEKDRSAFNKDRSRKDGLQGMCRECRAKYNARWYHKRGGKERKAKVQAKNYARWYHERGGKEQKRTYKHSERGKQLRAKADTRRFFGDSRLLLLKPHLLKAQFNRCPICMTSAEQIEQTYGFAFDHSHTSDMLRGLLCGCCNTRLGLWNADELTDAWKVFDSLKDKSGPKGQKLLRAIKYFDQTTFDKIGLVFVCIGRLSSKKYSKKQLTLLRAQNDTNLSTVLARWEKIKELAA